MSTDENGATTETTSTNNNINNINPSLVEENFEAYRLWCVYGTVCLLLLWVFIFYAWCHYRNVISNVIATDNTTGSQESIEVQFPLIRSTSDIHFNTCDDDRSFLLTPETAKIDKATLRKRIT